MRRSHAVVLGFLVLLGAAPAAETARTALPDPLVGWACPPPQPHELSGRIKGPPEITDLVAEPGEGCADVDDKRCVALATAGAPPPDQVTRVAVADRRLVVIAGEAAHVYDAAADRWTRAESHAGLPGARPHLFTWGERLLVVGTVAHQGVAAALDPATGRWEALPPLPRPITGDTVLLGDALVVRMPPQVHGQVHGWTWSAKTGAVGEIPPRVAPDAAALVADGPGLLLWGGYTNADPKQPTAEGAFYDLATGAWRSLPTGPPAAYGAQASWDGERYVLARGLRSTPEDSGAPAWPVDVAWAWDPASDSWSEVGWDPLTHPADRVRRDGARIRPTPVATDPLVPTLGGIEPVPMVPRSGGTSDRFSCGAAVYRPVLAGLGDKSWLVLLDGLQRVELRSGRISPVAKPRSSAIIASLGDELVVWGGYTQEVVGMSSCCGTAGTPPQDVDRIERTWHPDGFRIRVD